MADNTDYKMHICLLIILVAAAYLRFTGLDWGTDHATGAFHPFHPDETTIIDNSRWVDTDLKKIVAPYGKAPMYILWSVARIAGGLLGIDPFDLTDNTIARSTYRLARTITAMLGLLTVWVVYLIGNRLGDKWVGLLAALFLAFSAGHIQQSHYYTVDVPFAFWLTLSLYLILRMPGAGRAIYIACGVASGLAAGTRLAGVWLGVPFIITHLMEGKGIGQRFKKLLTPEVGCYLLAAFLVTSICEPYLLLDPTHFFAATDVLQMMGSIKVVTGESVYIWTLSDFATTKYLFHITNLLPLSFGTVLTIVSILGAVLFLIKRPGTGIVILSWLLIYFLFIGRLHSKPFRYMIPLLPVLVVMGAWALGYLSNILRKREVPNWIVFIPWVLVALPTVAYGLAFSRIYHLEDSRFAAMKWIQNNIGEGTHVLAERGGYPTSWMVPDDKYNRRLDDATFFITADGGLPYYSQIEFLKGRLEDIEWIVLIRENRMRQFEAVPDIFPIAHQFYKRLGDGSLGFDAVAEFKVAPGLAGLTWDETEVEPTFSAFDHPQVVIYKLREEHDLPATLSHWSYATGQDPALPDLYLDRGLDAYLEKNWEDAYNQFDRALQIKPGLVLGNVLRRAACLKLGRLDEAHAQWKVSSTFPTNKLIQSVSSLYRMGLDTEGGEYVTYTSTQDQQSGHLSRFTATYANIGNRLVNEKRWAAAVNALSQAVSFGDAPADTWFLLAKSQEQIGELGKAWYAIDQAMQLNPEDEAYHVLLMNLGTKLYRQGALVEASAVYLKALQLNPDLVEAALNLGVLELESGRLGEAEKWLRHASEITPKDPQVHLYLGVAYLKSGKQDNAVSAFRRVLELDPDNQQARSALQSLTP